MSSFPSAIVGGLLFGQLLLVRLVTSADLSSVWVAGKQLHIGCWFRERFGIPCPACGLTRSTILFLYGHLEQAFTLNAAGPVLVGGLVIFAGLMVYKSFAPRTMASRTIPLFMVALGWLFALVMFGQWIVKL